MTSVDTNLKVPSTDEERDLVIHQLQLKKASDLDNIHNKFVSHFGPITKSGRLQYLNCYTQDCCIPKPDTEQRSQLLPSQGNH